MTYYVGDSPAQPVVIEPARGDEPIDLTLFAGGTAVLRDPAGDPVTPAPDVDLSTDVVVVDWPEGFEFTDPGLYVLSVTLEDLDTGVRERLAPVRFVAQDDALGWLTLDTARERWPDARAITDWQLWELLEVARHEVLAYAYKLPGDALPPLPVIEAQAEHARNILNASTVDPSTGENGEGSFALQAYPMDWTVKQRLRAWHPPVVG